MATRYQKRRTIFPGIRLNQSGPFKVSSVTFGRPGFISYTLGGKGRKHLNVDLPGGFSWRKDFGKNDEEREAKKQAKAEAKAAKAQAKQRQRDMPAVAPAPVSAPQPGMMTAAVARAEPDWVMFTCTLGIGVGLGAWLF